MKIRKIKALLAFVIFVLLACVTVGLATHARSVEHPQNIVRAELHIYEVAAVVEGVRAEDGLVLFVDWNGEGWFYEIESENFSVGQIVILEFDDMGTANIYDDEIVKVRLSR